MVSAKHVHVSSKAERGEAWGCALELHWEMLRQRVVILGCSALCPAECSGLQEYDCSLQATSPCQHQPSMPPDVVLGEDKG